MTSITNKETALLGLLHEGPMHPYQIEKVVQFRDMRFWTEISMSSIYKVLSNLEVKGLVTSEVSISDSNKPQRTYSLTEEGSRALSKRVIEILSEPEHLIFRVDLGTYNMDAADPKDIEKALESYGKRLREDLKGYKDLEVFMRDLQCSENRLAVAVRPQFLIEGELEWLDAFRKKVLKVA
jgi:DNA-binding PadR family transcriptional regulator